MDNRQTKKPIYKNIWFYIILSFFILLISLSVHDILVTGEIKEKNRIESSKKIKQSKEKVAREESIKRRKAQEASISVSISESTVEVQRIAESKVAESKSIVASQQASYLARQRYLAKIRAQQSRVKTGSATKPATPSSKPNTAPKSPQSTQPNVVKESSANAGTSAGTTK